MRLGLTFTCAAPGVEECQEAQERPLALAARLARAKAGAVAVHHPAAVVIGSDQVAVRQDPVQGELILGKPGTAARCLEQLRGCSGQAVSFHTAVAVFRQSNEHLVEFIDTTRVMFRLLDEASIARYVAIESPFDCAGGFKSEALGIALCESIDSVDPTSLIGLPLIRLAAALRAFGFNLP